MLPHAARLHSSREFSTVIRSGRRAATSRLVVHLLPAAHSSPADAPARAGFVVSRQVGNSVVRHRVTRQLRPLVLRRLGVLPPGTDLVVRALPASATASSAELEADLSAGLRVAARRAGIAS